MLTWTTLGIYHKPADFTCSSGVCVGQTSVVKTAFVNLQRMINGWAKLFGLKTVTLDGKIGSGTAAAFVAILPMARAALEPAELMDLGVIQSPTAEHLASAAVELADWLFRAAQAPDPTTPPAMVFTAEMMKALPTPTPSPSLTRTPPPAEKPLWPWIAGGAGAVVVLGGLAYALLRTRRVR